MPETVRGRGWDEIKNILFRLLVAAALTLAAFALSSPAHGQQASGLYTSQFQSAGARKEPAITSPAEAQFPILGCGIVRG